jgi:hypothetical protein
VPKLEDSQVFITYGELKRLTDQAAIAQRPSPPPPVPVVPACLTQVRYQLKFEKTTPQLIATFTAESLSSGWASLPLGSFHSAAQDPVQPSTRLATPSTVRFEERRKSQCLAGRPWVNGHTCAQPASPSAELALDGVQGNYMSVKAMVSGC